MPRSGERSGGLDYLSVSKTPQTPQGDLRTAVKILTANVVFASLSWSAPGYQNNTSLGKKIYYVPTVAGPKFLSPVSYFQSQGQVKRLSQSRRREPLTHTTT